MPRWLPAFLLGFTLLWLAGLAYVQHAWSLQAPADLHQARAQHHNSKNNHNNNEAGENGDDDSEWYRVRRTEWEKAEERRDGYLITSDSSRIRQRVRAACCRHNATSTGVGQPGVSWQRAYAALHRGTLALRRRLNGEARRHQETMAHLTKLPLTPTTLNDAAAAAAASVEQDFEHYSGGKLQHREGNNTTDDDDEPVVSIGQEKYLVYSCLLGQHCGGWGDRMFGVMNAFFVALLTYRTFLIDWELPPPAEAELEPVPRSDLSPDLLHLLRQQREKDEEKDEEEERKVESSNDELAGFALRTYVEMVNRIKREAQLLDDSGGRKRKLRQFSIARLLEPTNIDWRFSKKDLAPLLKQKDVTYIDTIEQHASQWKGKPLSEVDIEKTMFQKKKVVIWRTNNWYANAISGNPLYREKIKKYFGVDPSISFADMAALQSWSSQLYGCFVNFLFRPVAPLRAIVAAHAERMHRGGFTLGVQLRMGGNSVSWSDPTRNKPTDVPLFFRCAQDLLYSPTNASGLPLAEPNGPHKPPAKGEAPWQVFVMSDSDEVKKRIKAKLQAKALTVNLPVAHIERSGSSFESYVTIVVEAWLLGECDFIVSSRSNLGWFAAKRTLHDFATYISPDRQCFYNRGIYADQPAFTYAAPQKTTKQVSSSHEEAPTEVAANESADDDTVNTQ